MNQTELQSVQTRVRWTPFSILLLLSIWAVLYIGGLFTPGLLDDVDSIYIEIAREMLVRHNFVTPYIDGIRFFDKPPLMYWLAAGSMKVFGVHDWAGRLPLAVLSLVLLIATYALALRLFSGCSPAKQPDRAALYSALALATCIGPYLYTRFYIPDIVVALWMTLAVHAFLVALERIQTNSRSALLPCLAFGAVTGLNLLTKGLIGVVFPLGFVFLYLVLTRQLRLLPKFHLISSTLVLLAIAAPWHIMAALQNPAIPLPSGVGLPARGGWAWFYLYNEHIARFLSRRIPHDYGQVPVPLFWMLAAIWIFPWVMFLPGAIRAYVHRVQSRHLPFGRDAFKEPQRQTALVLLLWAGIVLVFFTLSARQEYYSLPALPALALAAGGFAAEADRGSQSTIREQASSSALAWHKWLLLPLGTVCALVAFFFAITAPHVAADTDIATLLNQGGAYNLSLGHLFDLTGRAMGLFRGPLIAFGFSMLALGPVSWLMRRSGMTFVANLALAAGGAALLLCMHAGLVRFYPTLGSKELASAILSEQKLHPKSGDLILIDGELTAGSTLLFYTEQPVHLVNGHVNGPWYGSFWQDSPHIFEDDNSLRRLWAGPHRLFLLTYHPDERIPDLKRFGPVRMLADEGGKEILVNQP